MFERTLVIMKPDVLARGIFGEIMTRFERLGLKPVAMKMFNASREAAAEHYKKDDEWLIEKGMLMIKNKGLDEASEDAKAHGQSIIDGLLDDITIYPVVGIILEGHNAVATVKKLVGPTSPADAAPGTIRGDYSQDSYTLANKLNRPVANIIHCTDDPSESQREIDLWFDEADIIDWVQPSEGLRFREGK